MRNSYDITHINCQICGNDNYRKIHEASIDTGQVFGKISVVNVICNVCGFIYQNPRLTDSSLNFFYTHSKLSSGSIFRSSSPGSRQDTLIKERSRYIEESVKQLNNDGPFLIIDVGCSHGNLLASLNMADWEMLGIEPSRSAARAANDMGINVINDFFENVHLDDNTADIISLISILEHAKDINHIINKSKKSLKPGGVLIVEVPDSLKPTIQISGYFAFEHLSGFTIHTLTTLLGKHGFSVIDIDKNMSVPNLRVCAALKENVELKPSNNREKIYATIKIIEDYNKKRNEFIAAATNKLGNLMMSWEKENLAVGVFGAGVHSHLLFDCSDLSSIVKYIFDNDPNKQGEFFLNWEVLPSSMIDKLKLDVIIISSKDFQNEIYDQIYPMCSERNISIIRLY